MRSARPPVPGWPAGAGIGRLEPVRRFDRWAASYDCSQLQSVLYGPVHDAVLSYARRHVQRPGQILDVGCGTGRLSARLLAGYRHARVTGVDASMGMIRHAAAAAGNYRARFAAAAAEQLPFADAAFDLVVVTLSLAHWADQAAGLAEMGRVMAPGATLVAADISPVWRFRPLIAPPRRRSACGLPSLITACGFRVEHVEPIRSVALIADAALVAARAPPGPRKAGTRRGTAAARPQRARAAQH